MIQSIILVDPKAMSGNTRAIVSQLEAKGEQQTVRGEQYNGWAVNGNKGGSKQSEVSYIMAGLLIVTRGLICKNIMEFKSDETKRLQAKNLLPVPGYWSTVIVERNKCGVRTYNPRMILRH